MLSRAAGGTLFLDELTALPGPAQTRLLRALREGQTQPLGGSRFFPVTARVIAAARAPLESEVRAGRLRQDLAATLGETRVTVPPLRERREDIMVLARRFAEETAMERGRPLRGISEAAWQLLLAHAWPGNVRELRDVIRRAVVRSEDEVEPDHLWPRGRRAETGSPRSSGGGLSLRELAGAGGGRGGAASHSRGAAREPREQERGGPGAQDRLQDAPRQDAPVRHRRRRVPARLTSRSAYGSFARTVA